VRSKCSRALVTQSFTPQATAPKTFRRPQLASPGSSRSIKRLQKQPRIGWTFQRKLKTGDVLTYRVLRMDDQ